MMRFTSGLPLTPMTSRNRATPLPPEMGADERGYLPRRISDPFGEDRQASTCSCWQLLDFQYFRGRRTAAPVPPVRRPELCPCLRAVHPAPPTPGCRTCADAHHRSPPPLARGRCNSASNWRASTWTVARLVAALRGVGSASRSLSPSAWASSRARTSACATAASRALVARDRQLRAQVFGGALALLARGAHRIQFAQGAALAGLGPFLGDDELNPG